MFEIIQPEAISEVDPEGPNYCRLCGSLCEWGLPFKEKGRTVAYLYCPKHGRIAKAYLD